MEGQVVRERLDRFLPDANWFRIFSRHKTFIPHVTSLTMPWLYPNLRRQVEMWMWWLTALSSLKQYWSSKEECREIVKRAYNASSGRCPLWSLKLAPSVTLFKNRSSSPLAILLQGSKFFVHGDSIWAFFNCLQCNWNELVTVTFDSLLMRGS